ncbi:hypothetical protein GE09DRAFT_1204258 [Coniochaeta sp. 2T2.1]|nr:hypothetical protein GE09DRAFT_1204258 [Coniochaeta sp. 2T2.1]
MREPKRRRSTSSMTTTTSPSSRKSSISFIVVPLEDQIGLFCLADETAAAHGSEYFDVDIIAVHGLNGTAHSTWTAESGVLWLRDLLPKALPGCRVYTYGYPAQFAFSESVAMVRNYAHKLLGLVKSIQDNTQGKRSIIFVCHSLGGIVFKQALVTAHEDDAVYGELLRSIAGVVFMGTPHRGSGFATKGSAIGKVVNLFTLGEVIRTDLLGHLEYDAAPLLELTISVRNRLQNLKVVSCVERNRLLPMTPVVVEEGSAVLGLPGERIIYLNRDHRAICRFESEDGEYREVSGAILEIGRTLQKKADLVLTPQGPDDDEYLELISAYDIDDYQLTLPKPVPGTCRWILDDTVFLGSKYFEEAQTCGFIADVCHYFCDAKINKQRDARNIILGMIHQLVSHRPCLIQHLRRLSKIQKLGMVYSLKDVWNTFKDITSDPRCGTTCIIIDALDECEATSRRQLLNLLEEYTRESGRFPANKQVAKFIITSRPTLLVPPELTIINGVTTHRIAIDDGQEGYDEDLSKFIDQRLSLLFQSHDLPLEDRELLRTRLHSNSGQTFLWVTMVLTMMEERIEMTIQDFRDIIKSIPDNLQATYEEFLSRIPPKNQRTASKLFKLILATSQPLTLDEIRIAYAVDARHHTSQAVLSSTFPAMDMVLQRTIGPMVRISDSKVALVHQSAKDFLLQRERTNDELPDLNTITEENSALTLASACVYYLLLEDFAVDIRKLAKSQISTGSRMSGDNDEGGLGLMEMFNDEPEVLLADACPLVASEHKFYRYAALHWAEHFCLCEASAPEALIQGARSLLDQHTTNGSNWFSFFRESMSISHRSRNFAERLDPMSAAAYFNLHETVIHHLATENMGSQKDQALFWASEQGHCRIVKLLLQANADPTAPICDSQSALLVASQNGHLDCVVALLEDARTDVNQHGKKGRTALMFAGSGGYDDIVHALLGRGAQVDDVDHDNATALIWAVEGGHSSVVSELMKCSMTDLNRQDKQGRTAISWAAGDGLDDVTSVLLQSSRVDANLPDGDGQSPLLWAVHNGCTKAIRVLVQCTRVNRAAVDGHQRNAFHHTCWRGHSEVLQLLIDKGFSGIDDADGDGWTPLMWAIVHDKPHMVDKLIATGLVEVDQQDRTGRTALSWAVEHGHLNVVRTLLRAGADPSKSSDDKGTPLSIAYVYEGITPGHAMIRDELLAQIQKNKEEV